MCRRQKGGEMEIDMNNQEIQEYHKLRFPFLLIDNIVEIESGKRVQGYKYFSENEWFFHCNINDNQPVPFTVLIEILTQMFLMPILVLEGNKGKITKFLSADEVQVYNQVYPGQRMDIEANIESWKRGIITGVAKGYVDGELVCSAKLKHVIPDVMEQFRPVEK